MNITVLLAVAMVVLGMLIVYRTVEAGGGPAALGILIGALFVAAGIGRLWLHRGGWRR